MQITFTEYQSILWSRLREMGFVTMDIDIDNTGKRIARMGRTYTVRLSECH